MPMCIQSQQHRRTFLHNAHSCVTASVNATLVPFGYTKPTLQIQIVARQVAPASANE